MWTDNTSRRLLMMWMTCRGNAGRILPVVWIAWMTGRSSAGRILPVV